MNEEYKELSKEQSKQVCKNLGRLASQLNITHDTLAQQTGYQRTSITRLFSGRFAPHLDIIFCVLAAINELSKQNYSLKDIDVPNDFKPTE